MGARLLRLARALLSQFAPGWHPLRWPRLRGAVEFYVGCRRPRILPTRHGFELFVPEEDRSPIVVSLFLDGEYESEETRVIQGLLASGDVAVDVGANVGYMTCVMASRVGPGGHVHAFEPAPSSFTALEVNVARNGFRNVTCRPLALSATRGEAPLYLAADNPGDNTLVEVQGREAVVVETERFDDYWRGRDGRVRLVKIDVQGHELQVLLGMRGSLGQGLVDSLLIEVWPSRLQQAGTTTAQLIEFLASLSWNERIVSTTARRVFADLYEIRRAAVSLEGDPHVSFNVLLTRS